MHSTTSNTWQCHLHIWPEDDSKKIDAEEMEAFIWEITAYAEARGWLIMGTFNYDDDSAEASENRPSIPMQ
jgi:hypothetical protein